MALDRDRQADQATRSVTITRIYVRNTAMGPNANKSNCIYITRATVNLCVKSKPSMTKVHNQGEFPKGGISGLRGRSGTTDWQTQLLVY